jgi:hypothetical protein
MKKFAFIFAPLLFLMLSFSNTAQAQSQDKYKVIQGLSYLHTQVSLILTNWDVHPLNKIPLDGIEAEFQNHFVEEMAHDEEWVEFILVEDNLLDRFGEGLSPEVGGAIEENLEFYDKIFQMLRDADEVSLQIEDMLDALKAAEERLYLTIFPAIIK